jgi:uncharacterized protein YbjT (DUF2867 family)
VSSRDWATSPAVEVRRTNLDDAEALAGDLAGCETAYYLVHTMPSSSPGSVDYDKRLAMQFARAARKAGVRRIIYLGWLGETGHGLRPFLAARLEVEKALKSTGVPLTVMRAAMILGSGSASFEILRCLVERLPLMIPAKWVNTAFQPITVRNVIDYLAGALGEPRTAGDSFDIGGPDVLCYRELMQIMAEELGLRHRWIFPAPVHAPRLSSYWIHLVTPLNHRVVLPLAEGLKNPVVCRENRIRELIPQQLLGAREAIRAALAKIAENQVRTTWSMAGSIPGEPDWAGGKAFRDQRDTTIDVPDWAAFRAVCKLGGRRGWHAAESLWAIRGWMDRLVGGPGLRRGRRNPDRIGYGEAIDFWRVVRFDRDKRLTLRAEMKLPGEADLEFRIESLGPGRCVLRQTALFLPRGLFGHLYWYAVMPFHFIVFRGMLGGIRRDARQIYAAEKQQMAVSERV